MRFEKIIPDQRLQAFVKHFAISETESETEYKVFPSTGLVIGFQYRGKLSLVSGNHEQELAPSGITGMVDRFRIFKNSAGIGSVLVFFTEIGFAHFASHPAYELFNLSVSLEDVFQKSKLAEVEEKLSLAHNDRQRIQVVEKFLLSQLSQLEYDKLIVEAVKRIYRSGGTIRIKELHESLFISQSPFEKRFRKLVGTTPKKFASIVRFNSVLDQMDGTKSLAEICFDNHFFDQAHFIKNFRQYTGSTPEQFKKSK